MSRPKGSVSDPTLEVVRSPGRAVARLAKQVEHGLTPLELSLPQYRILGMLAEGAAASSALAGRLAVSPPSVTSVVDGLVARGFVVREPDPADRRRLNLALTEAGRQVLVDADASVGARLDLIASHLSPDAAADAVAALEPWHDALDAYREEKRRETAPS
jgi:DNA-binding MarR family transcriptional regulator